MAQGDLNFRRVRGYGQNQQIHIALERGGFLLEKALCGLIQKVRWMLVDWAPHIQTDNQNNIIFTESCQGCLARLSEISQRRAEGITKSRASRNPSPVAP